MNLHLYIKRRSSNSVESYCLTEERSVEILEYDFVLFVLESKEELTASSLEFIIGNTVLQFNETSHFNNHQYYYFLESEEIKNLLPDERYFTNEQFEVFGKREKFSRLFINELGMCSPQVKASKDLISFNSIRITSPKINDKNFNLIIEYLMFNDYFDEKILYRNTLDSSSNNLSNSFLEGVKKLYEYSKKMVEVLWQFKHNSILNKEVGYQIEEYNTSSIVDSNALPWLIDNLTEISRVRNTRENYSFKRGSAGFEIKNIPQPFRKDNYDTYENRIILGFLDTLITVINDKKSQFESNDRLRSRNFSDFNDYLIYSLNNLIAFLLGRISENFLQVHRFFTQDLKVTSKIAGFPHRIEGFLRKPNYKLFLEVMYFSRHLFAFKVLSSKKFQLEIESFDKLYEVFCLYFLRDTITAATEIEDIAYKQTPNQNNKLSGVYTFWNENFKLKLYYETLPEEIIQLARADKKYHENPDFILEIKSDEKKFFVVIDAKYKVYTNPKKFNVEIGVLTYKYLHRIGSTNPSSKVLGLYTLSLGSTNSHKFIHKNKFDLFSDEPVYPQIGSLELNPVRITINNNPFKNILERYLNLCSKPNQG